jgi:hypothetical protein
MFPDIFNDDAFSLVSLTAVISNQDHIPGRAGELAFVGVGEGVSTTSVSFEQVGGAISLIQTTRRGAPAPQETQDKRTLRAVEIPQVKLEDTIGVHQIQNIRQLGSTDSLRGARSVIDAQIGKMGLRHDLTLENLRLGALRGVVLDKDGTEILDLYDFFGVEPVEEWDFSEVLNAAGTEASFDTVRTFCHRVTRSIKRNLKAPWPAGARIHAFAGDNFFDRIVDATSVKNVWDGWAAAERRLGGNYAHGIYEFGGILWENYQGTDDNETVAIDSDGVRFFVTGVPGLYAEYYAPADFMETVNTIGLPRYAKIAPDGRFNRSIFLHTQQNPLPICTRPRSLQSGTLNPVTE